MTGPRYLGLSAYPRVRHFHRHQRRGWWLVLALALIAGIVAWLAMDGGQVVPPFNRISIQPPL